MLFANVLMAGMLVWVAGDWRMWLEWPVAQRASTLAVVCVGGLLTYLAVLFLTGMRAADFRRQA
jgi:putative peptidoglycan lipid II flippase